MENKETGKNDSIYEMMFSSLSDAEYHELRSLIMGLDVKDLEKLRLWLTDPDAFAEELGILIPISIKQLIDKRIVLPETILPIVEEAIEKSVIRNPQKLANALYPVMGPAIRKAVSEDIKKLLDTVNNSIEHSFSFKRLGYRLKALSTGRSYTEILLANTYIYRVRQMFLIHRETGIMLQHVVDEAGDFKDPDLVSSMLKAINDFVHDSFTIDTNSDIETIEVGGYTVWLEQGPYAIVAGIVEGNPPPELREVFKQSLENIHIEFSRYLTRFDGDISPFEDNKGNLKLCLQNQQKEKKTKGPYAVLVVLFLILLAAAYWIYTSVEENNRWNSYIKALVQEPGIVLTGEGYQQGMRFVTGLKDPLASDPVSMLIEYGFEKTKVNSTWKPYISLEDQFVTLRGDFLFAGKDVEKKHNDIPVFDTLNRIYHLLYLIGKHKFVFDKSVVELSEKQQLTFDSLFLEIKELSELVKKPHDVKVHINGHTNTSGSAGINEEYIDIRARLIKGLLEENGVPGSLLEKNIYIYDSGKMPSGINARSVTFDAAFNQVQR